MLGCPTTKPIGIKICICGPTQTHRQPPHRHAGFVQAVSRGGRAITSLEKFHSLVLPHCPATSKARFPATKRSPHRQRRTFTSAKLITEAPSASPDWLHFLCLRSREKPLHRLFYLTLSASEIAYLAYYSYYVSMKLSLTLSTSMLVC